VDLPGIHDLSGSSEDEAVATRFLRLTPPDLLLVLLGQAHLSVLICQAHLSVRHQKSLDPVMVPPLADPIGDRCGLLRHLEPLAECLGKPLQSRAGQSPNGGEDLLDGGRIEGSSLCSASGCALAFSRCCLS
jgi:ferrous iron transport protein B